MKKIITVICVSVVASLYAKENAAPAEKETTGTILSQRVMANCAAPGASRELWANNVRTIIFSGGDMWWDRTGTTNAYYFVPAVQNRNLGASSSFAGSIWLGGLDAGGQLKVAAMTYRQNGIDFWPGPLDTISASTDPETCSLYDNIFSMTRAEVDAFHTNKVMTDNILNWPGNGDVTKNRGRRLAPFVDVNLDGLYDPLSGDYPAYDVENKAEKDNLGFCKTKLFGDFTLFWIFNDNGGIHTETSGVAIGVEVRAQAFAFKTNDDINNMTFYSYEVFNRSSFQLNKTYFTIWNDADLGYFLDDYVGCDVKRGLGYIYNADPFDENFRGVVGYGDYPPSLGCDFFKGPLADEGDQIDNDADGIIDEPGETLQMSRFTYYNNNYGAFPPQTTNPDIAIHYYNFMTGFWKDGSPFTQGGNAYGGTAPATFVYDGNPVNGTGWTEKGSGNLPGDRRFLQSAGPFTLKPGAVNEITFGMPWAQSPSKGGNIESLQLLFSADDKAQALFDNCFKLLDGPEAPTMTIQELNNELIFYLTNEKGKSNNYKQFNNDYAEEDITIIKDINSNNPKLRNPDRFYRFEGYIVYQLRNKDVGVTDLSDPSKAIPVFQCDVENGVSRLINYEQDNSIGKLVPRVMVEGENKGVRSTFKLTQDAFSTQENRTLVNNKTYHFVAIAYAHNEYLPYAPDVSPDILEANYLGQKRPFLAGRKFKRASGTPHLTDPEKGGTVINSMYGFGPKITRIEGQGNGGNRLTLTRESEDAIVKSPTGFVEKITYENAQGPVNIKVVDPLNVRNSEYQLRFINWQVNDPMPGQGTNAMIAATSTANTSIGTLAALNVNSTSWELMDLKSKKLYYPTEITGAPGDTHFQNIKVGNEYYFPELGFSVNIKQVADPGERVNKFTNFKLLSDTANYTGPLPGSFIGANTSYENGASGWFAPIPDIDAPIPFNWIKSGNDKTDGAEDAHYDKVGGKVQAFYDPNKEFGDVLGGTWAPYPLTSTGGTFFDAITGASGRYFGGPGFGGRIWADDKYFFKQVDDKVRPDYDNTDLRKTSSVLIVLTRDKSKWSRCPVLEMQEKSQYSEGNAIFFSPRNRASVDKNGKAGDGVVTSDPNDADFISAKGMGWFPGYAINLETGERLNVAFGEDSFQKENNGNDMMWNPTSSINTPFSYAFGGKHFIYVFGGNTIKSEFSASAYKWATTLAGTPYGVGRYDNAQRIMRMFNAFFQPDVYSDALSGGNLGAFDAVVRDIMWVSMPTVAQGFSFKSPDQMPSDVRIQINVAKPYRYGFSGIAELPAGRQLPTVLNKITEAVNQPSLLTTHVSSSPKNNNFPMYTFKTDDIATLYDKSEIAANALDHIRVVPNPYYGSSAYETNRISNFVRITNLPGKCTIRIYTMNGTLVRTITRDVVGQEDIFIGNDAGDDLRRSKRVSYEDWDLKNQNNITVSSGLYIFHIDAPNLGEKIVKWFGVMRPLDVQNY